MQKIIIRGDESIIVCPQCQTCAEKRGVGGLDKDGSKVKLRQAHTHTETDKHGSKDSKTDNPIYKDKH